MNLSVLFGTAFVVIVGAFLAAAVLQRAHRTAPGSGTQRFAPEQVRRLALSAVFPAVGAVFAFTLPPSSFRNSPVLIALVAFAMILCLVAMAAIIRTRSDYVEVCLKELVIRQLTREWRIPWTDFLDVVDRGPYQLVVLRRGSEDTAPAMHGSRSRGGRIKKDEVYITTLHLSADQAVIKAAVLAGADRWRNDSA